MFAQYGGYTNNYLMELQKTRVVWALADVIEYQAFYLLDERLLAS